MPPGGPPADGERGRGGGTVGFASRREAAMLSLEEADRSKKGSLDAPIRDLVRLLNASPNAFTTSSCSGRVALFAEPPERAPGEKKGKGGEWLHVSHERADADAVWEALQRYLTNGAGGSQAARQPLTFRFDPFILAAECRSLSDAQGLVRVARECGFRETGMIASGGSLGAPGRLLVSVRCSIRLEVPLTDEGGELITGESYVRHLCSWANKKFDANRERYGRLESALAAGRHLPGEGRAGGGDINDLRPAFRALAQRQGALLQRLKRAEEAAAGGVTTGPSFGHSGHEPNEGPAPTVLAVAKGSAKAWKDALKDAGWLDRSRPVGTCHSEGQILFPISDVASSALKATLEPGAGFSAPEALPGGIIRALASHRGGVRVLEAPAAPSGPSRSRNREASSPHDKLRDSILKLLEEAGHSARVEFRRYLGGGDEDALERIVVRALPRRWEKLGDLVLLPAGAMRACPWAALESSGRLWPAVAEALGCSRLGRQAPIAENGRRESRAELLLGRDGWVCHRENGIYYRFDVSKCMFSSGNVTEKARVARLPCHGETVVDMYAGIGYYTLPFLVHAGAARVLACEWNPNAVQALRESLRQNDVEGRCEVREGDCRQVCPLGVADRVSLGLLPSSREGWPAAVRALKDAGGYLHVHENVFEESGGALGAFARSIESDLEEIAARERGRPWRARVVHTERVKWYAPRVRHVVFDVLCSPRGGAAPGGTIALSHPLPDLAADATVEEA